MSIILQLYPHSLSYQPRTFMNLPSITFVDFASNITELIGNTPLVRLNRITEGVKGELVAKLDLKRMAFDNVVNYYILFYKAMEWGLHLSNEEVLDYIKSIPIFQVNGTFSGSRYRQVLEMQRLNPQKFENDIRKHLLFKRIQERITGGFKISDQEILEEFAKSNEKIRADYISIPFERFASQVKVGLEELKVHYESHQEEYNLGERRSVEYLLPGRGHVPA